jgi:hypothetical protein
VSFEAHVKPLFRSRDRQSMRFAFDLWSSADVQAHAADILSRLDNGTMPGPTLTSPMEAIRVRPGLERVGRGAPGADTGMLTWASLRFETSASGISVPASAASDSGLWRRCFIRLR